MSWTDDRVARLRDLWTGGHSAAVIAGILGGVSRNSVIGKVNQLGLVRSDGSAAPALVAVDDGQKPAEVRPSGRRLRRKPLLVGRPFDRSPFPECQFIRGEPRDRGFCGAPTLEMKDGRRSSYCPRHHARCWETQQPARRAVPKDAA
jgi:hypothetical protein